MSDEKSLSRVASAFQEITKDLNQLHSEELKYVYASLGSGISPDLVKEKTLEHFQNHRQLLSKRLEILLLRLRAMPE